MRNSRDYGTSVLVNQVASLRVFYGGFRVLMFWVLGVFWTFIPVSPNLTIRMPGFWLHSLAKRAEIYIFGTFYETSPPIASGVSISYRDVRELG